MTPRRRESAEAAPDTVEIRVPQPDGEIAFASAGDEAVTFEVTDHVVTVPASLATQFLGVVDGSEVADGSQLVEGDTLDQPQE